MEILNTLFAIVYYNLYLMTDFPFLFVNYVGKKYEFIHIYIILNYNYNVYFMTPEHSSLFIKDNQNLR